MRRLVASAVVLAVLSGSAAAEPSKRRTRVVRYGGWVAAVDALSIVTVPGGLLVMFLAQPGSIDGPSKPNKGGVEVGFAVMAFPYLLAPIAHLGHRNWRGALWSWGLRIALAAPTAIAVARSGGYDKHLDDYAALAGIAMVIDWTVIAQKRVTVAPMPVPGGAALALSGRF